MEQRNEYLETKGNSETVKYNIQNENLTGVYDSKLEAMEEKLITWRQMNRNCLIQKMKKKKKKKKHFKKEILSNLWDKIKWSNMHVVGAQGEEEKANRSGKNIWKDNGWIFSQSDEEHQLTYSGNSVSYQQDKSKDSITDAS